MKNIEQENITNFNNVVICKNCGEEAWRESCNIGVGIIYGPYGCPCGWSEDDRYNIIDGNKITKKGSRIDQWGGLTPMRNTNA
jgi:hypothetical protein